MLGIEKDAVRPLLLPPFFFLFFFVGFAVFAAVATKPPETSSGADVANISVKHVTKRNSVVMHFMIDYDDGKRKEKRNGLSLVEEVFIANFSLGFQILFPDIDIYRIEDRNNIG